MLKTKKNVLKFELSLFLCLFTAYLGLCLVPGGLVEGLDLGGPGVAGEELGVEAVAGGVVSLEPGEGDQVPCGWN